jgi:hypothetical protein
MGTTPERPEAGGGFEPPSGSAGGDWLPPVPPGPQPGPPPGWRISPKAVDLDPNDQGGPAPWEDPGNSVAGVALGMSVAAFGTFFVGAGVLAFPLGLVGTILSVIGRDRIQRGETRQGKVEVGVGLAVGVVTTVLGALLLVALIAK